MYYAQSESRATRNRCGSSGTFGSRCRALVRAAQISSRASSIATAQRSSVMQKLFLRLATTSLETLGDRHDPSSSLDTVKRTHQPCSSGHPSPSFPCHLPSFPCHLPSFPCHLPSFPCHLPSFPCHFPSFPCHFPSFPCHLPSLSPHLPSFPRKRESIPVNEPRNPSFEEPWVALHVRRSKAAARRGRARAQGPMKTPGDRIPDRSATVRASGAARAG